MTGLETFTPLNRTVRLAGRDVAIAPLKLRQMVAAGAAARPIMALLWVGDHGEILERHAADARAVIVHGIGLSEAEADELDGAEVVEALSAWFEVNADFLLRRLAPAATAARQTARELMGRMVPDGEKPSPGSSSADTDLPTASS